MGENEYVELLTCLVRVVWAAAAGKLFLASMGIQSGTQSYGNTISHYLTQKILGYLLNLNCILQTFSVHINQ